MARRAIGALQQPAQKLSPVLSAKIPTYQQQQQQAINATKTINENEIKRDEHNYNLDNQTLN